MDIQVFALSCFILLIVGIFIGLMLAARKQQTTVNKILTETNVFDQAYNEGYENFVSICGNYMDTLSLLLSVAKPGSQDTDEERTTLLFNGKEISVSVVRLQALIVDIRSEVNKARHRAIKKYDKHINSYDLGVSNAIKALKNIEQNPILFRSVVGN